MSKRQIYTTVQKASESHSLGEEHILGWINHTDPAKRLPAVNISNTGNRPRWRIKIEELEKFLAARSNMQSAPRSAAKTRRPKPKREYV